MTQNQHELHAIKKIPEDLGVKFRFDASSFPTLDGDPAPLDRRVTAKEVIDLEMSDVKRIEEWRSFHHRFHHLPALSALYRCGAGMTNFHLDPYGHPALPVGRRIQLRPIDWRLFDRVAGGHAKNPR
jgi:hypothetical protein